MEKKSSGTPFTAYPLPSLDVKKTYRPSSAHLPVVDSLPGSSIIRSFSDHRLFSFVPIISV
jgi:hypothetical protein